MVNFLEKSGAGEEPWPLQKSTGMSNVRI